MKRILTITFINHFISSGLALIIPLLLLERNVNIAEIGIVISVLPLVFLAVRLFFAALADQVGWSRFYLLLNWPGTLFSTLIYSVANSTPIFLIGKIVEAVKVSSYWAVNRTAIFSLSPRQKATGATKNSAILSLSTAFGSAISGLALTVSGFVFTFSMLTFASALLAIPAALLWRTQERRTGATIQQTITLLNPRGKGKTFWFTSLIMLCYSLAFYPLFALLFPVFMAQQLGFDYFTIGVAFMTYGLLTASVIYISLSFSFNSRRVLVQSAIAIFVLLLLTNSGNYFFLLFLTLALSDGLGIGFFESIITKVTKNKQTVSVDIGFLHIPMRFAEFISVLCAGFISQSFGFMPVFVASGIFFMIFSILALHILKT